MGTRSRDGSLPGSSPSIARGAPLVLTAIASAAACVLATVGWQVAAARSEEPPGATPFRAFSEDSYWNTRLLPDTSSADPASATYIDYIRRNSVHDFVFIAGLGKDESLWSQPIYWADGASPTYAVENTCSWRQPPSFGALRIPPNARPSSDRDHELTIYNVPGGYVAALWQAEYDESTDRWAACGGEWYALRSNGLHGSLAEADDSRNWGHRGVPASVHAIRLDEVRAGEIRHVLMLSMRKPSPRYVFPMVGSDGESTAEDAPPQGSRVRIKPSVDLSEYKLSTGALVVAEALQQYGAVIGDSSGGPTSLQVQSCDSAGVSGCWSSSLSSFALKAIPLEAYEFVTPPAR